MAKHPELEVIDGTHAFKATHGCNTDQRLRDYGYKIKDRPKEGPDVWVHHGKEYTVEEALEEIHRRLMKLQG